MFAKGSSGCGIRPTHSAWSVGRVSHATASSFAAPSARQLVSRWSAESVRRHLILYGHTAPLASSAFLRGPCFEMATLRRIKLTIRRLTSMPLRRNIGHPTSRETLIMSQSGSAGAGVDALVTLAVFRASAMCDCPEKVIASSFFVASINVEGGSRERGTECARSSRCLVCHNE